MKPRQHTYLLMVFLGSILACGQSLADLNGDGHADAVFANYNNQLNRLCLGDGGGGFNCSEISADKNPSLSVALGDLNNDEILDVVFANKKQNRTCLGDGVGGFVCSNVSASMVHSWNVALGDLNGDGFLDAVFANQGTNQACLGDGAGQFSCTNGGIVSTSSSGVALGDVNGDGDLDAVFANNNHQINRVCLGDGMGGFTCSDVSADTEVSSSVALGDVNGDGDLDAIFANMNDRVNRVCLGDGMGGFTCSDVSSDDHTSTAVVLGDLNGDGELDAVFANAGGFQSNRACLGDGSGGFVCSVVSADLRNSLGVALGDLNGDNKLDAVFANFSSTNRSCLGDGNGGFICSNVSTNTEMSNYVALSPVTRTAMWDPTVGDPGTNGEIWDIARVNGEIYAVGRFDTVGPDSNDASIPANAVARWTGVEWEPVTISDNLEAFSIVRSVIEFNGQLVIGGNLHNMDGDQSGVFVLEGNQWKPLGGATAWQPQPGILPGQVFKLMVIDDTLYAGGSFIRSDCEHICKYTTGGTWKTVGNIASILDRPDRVYDLQVHKNRLYAAGDFTGGVRILDGTSWNLFSHTFSSHNIYALEVLEGKLYAGGNFNISYPGNAYQRIAVLNDVGEKWAQVYPVPSQNIWDLRGIQCDGKPFLQAFGAFISPGAHAAEYNLLAGTASEMDGGLTFTSPSSQVRVATCSTPLCDDSVFVGGLFDGAGIHTVGNIAEYVLPLGCGFSAVNPDGGCTIPPSGITSWWNLDEDTGPNSIDTVGPSDGAHVGTPLAINAVVGKGLSFNGSNEYVNVPDPDNVETSSGSISLWVRSSTDYAEPGQANDYIIGKQQTVRPNYSVLALYFPGSFHTAGSDGKVIFWIRDSQNTSSVRLTSSQSLNDGLWHFISAQWGSTGMKLYVDGVLDGSDGFTGWWDGNDGNLNIGTIDNRSDLTFGGDIDEVMFFDRGLTEAEVEQLSNPEAGAACKSNDPLGTLDALESLVNSLNTSDFDTPNNQSAFINKIDSVVKNIDLNGVISICSAIDKLADDILPKTDGDQKPKDWVTDPDAQQSTEAAVIYTINVLESAADSLGGCP